MKLSLPGRRSDNLEDRRSAGGGTGSGLPIGLGAKAGLPGLLLLLVLAFFGRGAFDSGGGGFDVNDPFNQFPQSVPGPSSAHPLPGAPDPDAKLVDFVSFVLDDVQNSWTAQFQQAGQTYRPAELVLFTNATQSGCGAASSATGPFYCPADQTAYLDLDFFRELTDRFQAPGDFAQAYVIAHELGHHVQNLTGVSDEVARLSSENPGDANELSVRLELQADCLAGIWGHSTYERGILEDGDIEEGLGAAAAIGDDRIQKQSTGRINPDTWTHGSSAQRVKWFKRGFQNGDINDCDTFSGDI